MQTNGLIFLVIVAIWAVYLLQHWVSRRENLATARSVDRFSEAMRVLERRRHTSRRRDPAPVREMTDGRSDRPTTPTVSVKPSRPSLRAGAVMNQSDNGRVDSGRPFAGIGRATDPAARSRRPVVGASGSGRSVSVGNPLFKAAAAVTPAKVRAWALVTAVLIFVMTVVLTPMSVLPWWSPLIGLVALGGVVAWLRSRVIRASRSASTSPRQAAAPRASARADRAAAAPAASAPASEVPVYDIDAPTTATEGVVADQDEVPAEVAAPGTWAPVAVPPPTYTLKARAERPEPEPAPTVEAPSTAAKYADTPVEDLPFDGLALDEDLEDLPAVHHRAG